MAETLSSTRRVVRTVCGDIAPEELGSCDSHEHFFLATPAQPGDEFQDVGKAIDEARALVASGACSAVDWTPIDLGRNPEGLRAVSQATGLHVVAATGFHASAHYAPEHWVRTATGEKLVELMCADLTSGVPAGIIKVGASYHHAHALEQMVLEAAAEAHRRTGAPICAHTEHGTYGLELVELLASRGVAPDRVVLAHLDRNPDPGLHAEIAETGTWLQYDGPGRAKYHPDSTILGLISELAERGYADQLLLGGDTGRRSLFRAYGGGPGLDYLFTRFKPRLERELGQELSNRIFISNPSRAFALVERP